ncbi:helix-turn-helix domain-containing protein [Mycobacterium sp. NPDC051198]
MTPRFDRFAWHRQFQGVKMPPAAARAAMVLFDHAGRGGECWPSIATLSAATGLSYHGARNGVAWLEDHGFLEKLIRGGRSGDSKPRATHYRLTLADTSSATPVVVEDDLKRHRGDSQAPPGGVSSATPVAPNRPENRPENRKEPPDPPERAPAAADPITNGDGRNAPAKQTRNPGRDIALAYSASLPTAIEDRLIGAISVQVNRCLDAGATLAAVTAGLRAWTASDSFSPTQIPAFVHKAANNGHRSTADDRVRDVQALKAKFPKPDGSTA